MRVIKKKAVAVLTGYIFSFGVSAQVPVDIIDASNQAAWWHPLSLHNDQPFAVYNAPGQTAGEHIVKVAKQINDGSWQHGVLKNQDGTVWQHSDDFGHDQPTIAVDGDGYIHVFADHHNDTWRYFRSQGPNDVTQLYRSTDIFYDGGSYTYPVAATAPNGDIYLIVRDANAIDTGVGKLFRWNNSTNMWLYVAAFASQQNTAVYPDDIKVDSSGNVHIIWEWAYDRPRADRHYGSYLKYSPATNTFSTVNGTTVNTPVTLSTADLFYQALETAEDFTSADKGKGLQSAKLAIGEASRPSVVYRYRNNENSSGSRDYDVTRIRWNGNAWVGKTILHENSDTIAAVGHSKVGDRVRAYYVTDDKQLVISEKIGGGNWSAYAYLSDKPIERIAVETASDGTDYIYAAAPKSIDQNQGYLTVTTIPDNLLQIEPVLEYEAEILQFTHTSSIREIQDSDASGGSYIMFEDSLPGDTISFLLEDIPTGTYRLKVRYKSHYSRGIAEVVMGQVTVGSIDMYSQYTGWDTAFMATISPQPGDSNVTFTISGRNQNSSDYKLAIDKFILAPVSQ